MKNQWNIKAVSLKTGLSTHVIRIWERRYNAILPDRTETNRRIYSDEDVKKLQLLNDAVKMGYSIGSIASLSIEELKNLLSTDKITNYAAPDNFSQNDLDARIEEFINAAEQLDSKKMERLIINLSIDLSLPVILEHFIMPLMIKIGHYWKNGSLRIAEEHLASTLIRKYLLYLLDSFDKNSESRKILMTTPKGQLHEIGAIVASIFAASEGWNVIYLGPDLPAAEIVVAAKKLNIKIICLSITMPNEDISSNQEFLNLKKMLDDDFVIIAGGSGVHFYESALKKVNAKIIKNLNDFRYLLETI